MYTIKYEPQFKKDYKKFKKEHPELIKDFKNTVIQLTQKGKVGKDYDLHPLNKCGGNYSGHFDYHLSEGTVDVVMIYKPHKTNSIIRFVRIGNHGDLFEGKEK